MLLKKAEARRSESGGGHSSTLGSLDYSGTDFGASEYGLEDVSRSGNRNQNGPARVHPASHRDLDQSGGSDSLEQLLAQSSGEENTISHVDGKGRSKATKFVGSGSGFSSRPRKEDGDLLLGKEIGKF